MLDHGQDRDGWLAVLYESAEAAARERGLDDWADDLAHAALVKLWPIRARGEELSTDAIETVVRRIADNERQKRRRATRRLAKLAQGQVGEADRVSPARRGIPSLAPRLMRLAKHHPRPGLFRFTVRAAALAVAQRPGVLLDGQYRLFDGVFRLGKTRAELAKEYGTKERAITKRIERTVKRPERVLVAEIAARCSPAVLAAIQAQARNPGVAKMRKPSRENLPDERLLEEIRQSLASLLDETPGLGLS